LLGSSKKKKEKRWRRETGQWKVMEEASSERLSLMGWGGGEKTHAPGTIEEPMPFKKCVERVCARKTDRDRKRV